MRITGGMEFVHAAKEMQEVRDIMERSAEVSEALDKSAEALFSPFSEIAPDMKAAKETAIQAVAELRSPEVLDTRISMRLIESNLSPKAWEAASAVERNQMMDQMFDIMMDEMQIPEMVRKDLCLLHSGSKTIGGNMVVSGHCNCFVGDTGYDKLKLVDKPVVEMHYGLMYQDFETALGSLYNQALKVMQQSTCLEPEGTYPDAKVQAQWENEVRHMANGSAIQSEMQPFAVNAEKHMLDRYHSILKHKGTMAKQISFK